MSAFIVGTDHIDLIVTAARTWRSDHYDNWLYIATPDGNQHAFDRNSTDDMTRLGGILLDTNVAAVNHRYNEDTPTPDYTFTPVAQFNTFPIGSVMNALNCYAYQACEHPTWLATLANALIEGIRSAGCRLLPGNKDLNFWEFTRDAAADAA